MQQPLLLRPLHSCSSSGNRCATKHQALHTRDARPSRVTSEEEARWPKRMHHRSNGTCTDPHAGCIIGSCPRTPANVDRLVDEGGVEAIICLQCELCHGALQIDWEPIRARALERGVPIVRVSVRDFDRLDQAKMLPEVRPP